MLRSRFRVRFFRLWFNPNGVAAFAATGLGAGTYYFEVKGVALNGTSGNYAGNVNLSLAPVPEPDSYAMLFAGLGLMGAIARRRGKSKTV